jgi:hypothetical protein
MNRSAIDRQINRRRGEAFGRSSLQLNENTYIQMLRPASQIAYIYKYL